MQEVLAGPDKVKRINGDGTTFALVHDGKTGHILVPRNFGCGDPNKTVLVGTREELEAEMDRVGVVDPNKPPNIAVVQAKLKDTKVELAAVIVLAKAAGVTDAAIAAAKPKPVGGKVEEVIR
jgi:hypothetical protein